MAQSLRELLLSLKVKVDKTAIGETDLAFAHAAKSAGTFERSATSALAPLRKISAQLTENTKKARELARALLPEGALPSASASQKRQELRDALGMKSHPTPPRPGASMAAPDVSAFLVPEAAPDFRTGPQKALAAVGEKFAAFRRSGEVAFAQVEAAADRFNKRFDGTVKAIFNARNAFAGFAAVVVATAVGRFVGDVIDGASAIKDMAERTRMSAETIQVWRGIAKDASVDASAVEGVFRKLSKSMHAAANGGKLQATAFKDLGVELKGADGALRPVEDVLIDAGAALAALDDDAKASALSVQLLGPAGAALVPAFNKGAAAVRALAAEMRENVSLNAEEVERLDAVGKAVERGTKKWSALKDRAIVAILPLLEALSRAFEKVSKWVLRMAKETSTLQTIFLALTGGGLFRIGTALFALVSRLGGARAAMALLGQGLRSAAGFAFKFLMPLLLIEDFLTFLSGGKSVFGRAFEEIFGEGGAQKVREGILKAFEEISEVLTEHVLPVIRDIANSEFFTGAVKLALDTVLSVLNLIGLAFSDNADKSDELASRFLKNSASIVDAIDGIIEKLSALWNMFNLDTLKTGINDAAEFLGIRDPNKSFEGQAAVPRVGSEPVTPASIRESFGAVVPPPTNSFYGGAAGKGSITLTDQRKIEVNVGAGPTPGATGRAVAGAVDETLTKDRRQTLNSL